MLFTSYEFIFFLACLLVLYYHTPERFQWMLLLAGSLFFYASFGPVYLIYIGISIVSTWFCGILLAKNLSKQKEYLDAHKTDLGREEKKLYKAGQKTARSRMQAVCILFNLGILAVMKYSNFFIGNINGIFSMIGREPLAFVSIALPLGISFYTLQAIGYLVDVGRGTVEAEENPFRLALFISFFPQVVQGPIARFGDLKKTLYGPHSYDGRTVSFGLQRVLWGFFKKLVVADRLMPFVLGVTADAGVYRGIYVLLGGFLYTVELYADFTGGIDISIGAAEALGIRLSENFNQPYFSTSLKEYWRRWHISMCSWFRDFVFYPVSTSRSMQNFSRFLRAKLNPTAGKRIPVYVSSFAVWFATGIWHGASWNFIVWGLLNFIILMASEELEPLYDKFHERFGLREKKGYRAFMMTRTFILVCFLNLFDCYASVGDTLSAIASAFCPANLPLLFSGEFEWFGLYASDFVVVGLAVALMCFISTKKERGEHIRETIDELSFPVRATIWSLLFLAVLIFGAYGIGYDSAQFIYNRF